MAYAQATCPLLEKRSLAQGVYDYVISCPDLAAQAQAGQFVHIRVPGHTLRRPISICAIDREAGALRIVFQVRGSGTDALSRLEPGQELDVLGPLGHGFTLLDPGMQAITIGGGIGVPPMLEIARHYKRNCTSIVGFRSKDAVILERDFIYLGTDFRLCTDDGTLGAKGFVTDLLRGRLRTQGADILYACGPTPMLKAVAAIAKEKGIRCQLSLEERMACGVGACLGCACRTVDQNGVEHYSHVCKDGPVFEAEEVVF